MVGWEGGKALITFWGEREANGWDFSLQTYCKLFIIILKHERDKLEKSFTKPLNLSRSPINTTGTNKSRNSNYKSVKSVNKTKKVWNKENNYSSQRSNAITLSLRNDEHTETEFINELKKELLNSQRTKEQLTEKILKTL